MTKEISVCYCDDCGKEIAKDRRENCRWCKADLCSDCTISVHFGGLCAPDKRFNYCKKCLPKVIEILKEHYSPTKTTSLKSCYGSGNTTFEISPEREEKTIPNDTLDDGFGNAWSASCPECRKKTMVVVRPGKAQCSNCG